MPQIDYSRFDSNFFHLTLQAKTCGPGNQKTHKDLASTEKEPDTIQQRSFTPTYYPNQCALQSFQTFPTPKNYFRLIICVD